MTDVLVLSLSGHRCSQSRACRRLALLVMSLVLYTVLASSILCLPTSALFVLLFRVLPPLLPLLCAVCTYHRVKHYFITQLDSSILARLCTGLLELISLFVLGDEVVVETAPRLQRVFTAHCDWIAASLRLIESL